MNDILYICIPSYNEEENIKEVVLSWAKVLDGKNEKSRIVIADSGSKDKTHEILLNLQKENNQIIVLSDTLKQHGPKLIAMYKYAIKEGADFIFQTDSDGQTDSNEFPDFWEEKEKYNAILGNRTVRGDGQ